MAALAERKRRNLVKTPAFDGCRCCYDPNSDGQGEYRALIDYKEAHPVVESTVDTFAEEAEEKKEAVNDSEEDSDDEFDYLLDEDFPANHELEEQRRAELEWEMLKAQVATQHGYGTHRQLHPGRVLAAAGLSGNASRRPPAVVLHLFDPDSTTSASLDHYLETELASQYKGTIFLRSGGRSVLLMNGALSQKVLGSLQPDRDMPALVTIRDGVVVNTCPRLQGLSADPEGPIEPRAVEQWLDHAGVLRSTPPLFDELCYIRPEEEALMDYMQTQKPPETFFDCGMEGCSKTFPHEHVGIKISEQDGLVLKEETVLGNDEK